MLRLAERPNLPIRRRLWLVAVWLTLWICSVGSATAEEHSSLPKPGDCALWAGQARLVARKLLQAIASLKAEGKCIIFSTHIMREVEKL